MRTSITEIPALTWEGRGRHRGGRAGWHLPDSALSVSSNKCWSCLHFCPCSVVSSKTKMRSSSAP